MKCSIPTIKFYKQSDKVNKLMVICVDDCEVLNLNKIYELCGHIFLSKQALHDGFWHRKQQRKINWATEDMQVWIIERRNGVRNEVTLVKLSSEWKLKL